jgi:methylamine dehydrogenase accessory protein MauD
MWLYAYWSFVAVVVAEAVMMLALMRQTGMLYERLMMNASGIGLPPGALAPLPSGRDLFGRTVALGATSGRQTMLFFLSTGCGACRPVMSTIPMVAGRIDCDLILVLHAKALNARLFLEEHWRGTGTPVFPVVADDRNELGERYKVTGVPHVVVVDEDGRIGAQASATSPEDLNRLLAQSTQWRRRRTSGEGTGRLAAAASIGSTS